MYNYRDILHMQNNHISHVRNHIYLHVSFLEVYIRNRFVARFGEVVWEVISPVDITIPFPARSLQLFQWDRNDLYDSTLTSLANPHEQNMRMQCEREQRTLRDRRYDTWQTLPDTSPFSSGINPGQPAYNHIQYSMT